MIKSLLFKLQILMEKNDFNLNLIIIINIE